VLSGVETLRGVAARHGTSPGAVALAWVLANPAVTAAIVGARRAGQLRDLVAAADLVLTADERSAIESATA
jgi:aryl-alcohol dehydrogenase-like predicted oxidoreductase